MRLPPPFLPGVLVAMAALGVVLGSSCGGVLTESRGVLTTPNFPGPPPVPLHCRWVIDASLVQDRNITVYLTQQYVIKGLFIYDYYKYSDKIDGKLIFGGGDQHPISTEYVRSNRPYVGVELILSNLDNNHIRVLQDLQDVYGFNISYEVTREGESARNSCSPIICSFVGQCRVSHDFRNYACDCPKNYSGPNCALGPMCRENPCKNGGVCRTTGTESIVCQCPANFSGVFCQYPPIEDKVRECGAERDKICNGSAGSIVEPGRMLYTINVALLDKTGSSLSAIHLCDDLSKSLVTEESLNGLKNNLSASLNRTVNELMAQYKLAKAYDFDIVDMTSDGKVTFRFKSYEGNTSQVAKVVDSLFQVASTQPLCRWSSHAMSNGQVKQCTDRNIYLSPFEMTFKHDPVLYLERVAANSYAPLSPASQVVFSCVVTGSPNVTFSWYKENHLVIPGQSNRIWTQTSSDSKGVITSLLGVDQLCPLDVGRWTCRVRDAHLKLQQSRSVDLYVLQEPNVRMQPPGTSVHKGEKVFLSCLVSNFDRNQWYEYSWSRNGVPFESGGEHVYERLDYPNGCLLRLENVTESATYRCHVKSSVGKAWSTAAAAARVEVLGNGELCEAEGEWPVVPVGAVAMLECPEGRQGSVASRRCSHLAEWQEPDYSACLPGEAIPLEEDLREIAVGYAPCTPSDVLRELYSVLRKRTTLRPHQGEAVLAVALEAWQMSGDHNQLLQMIDLLLAFPKALASPKVVNDIAKVSEKAAIAQIRSQNHTSLNRLSVSVTLPNGTDYASIVQTQQTQPKWFASFSFPHLEVSLPLPFVVVEFESLEHIIPYSSRLNLSNVVYKIVSTIAISSVPVPESGDNYPPNVDIEITFEEVSLNLSKFLDEHVFYWNLTCGYTRNLTSSPTHWDLGSCTTSIARIQEGGSSGPWLSWRRAIAFASLQSRVSVRCLCPAPGAYTVLLAGFAQKPDSGVASVAVILALWCCALEATAALLLPFVISWREKSPPTAPTAPTAPNAPPTVPSTSVLFTAFRVTSCTNTALVAIVMAVTMCKWDTLFPAVLLQCLFLFGVSLPTAHLCAVLPLGSCSRSHVVALVMSMVFLALWLSIRDLRSTLSQCWSSWLEWGEPVCWAVAVPSSLVATAAVVMAAMGRKLAAITTYSKHVHMHTDGRCGLVLRLCAILVCQLAFLLSAILYTSAPGLASHVAVVFASFLLGYSLLLCYVLRLEKQWPLLSVAWCNGDDPIDSPQTARTSSPLRNCQSNWRRHCNQVFSCRKEPNALPNEPCTSRTSAPSAASVPTTPALESSDSLRPLIGYRSERHPTWSQRNGTGTKLRQPLLRGLPATSGTGTSSLPLEELKPKSIGYLYMRGRGAKVTCTAEIRGEFLGAPKPKRTVLKSTMASVPQPQQSTHPQYQFRRRFLRLDDIEETSSAS